MKSFLVLGLVLGTASSKQKFAGTGHAHLRAGSQGPNRLLFNGTTLRSADDLMHFLDTDLSLNHSTVKKANATTGALNMEAMPPLSVFLPACLEHIMNLVNTLDRSYTDVQLISALEHECWMEQAFPNVSEDGFKHEAACRAFALDLVAARVEDLMNGTTTGYVNFCTGFYEHRVGNVTAAIAQPALEQPQGGSWMWVWILIIVVACCAVAIAVGYSYKQRQQGVGA